MIYMEDGRIKLDGIVLPGLIKSIEVTETAKVDEQEVEGSATKPKQATGYEDAKVNIELLIDDTESQTKYERYAVLRAVFRSPGQSVPQPIPIVNEDTAAHGIEKVIFKKLTKKSENKKSQLTASLELWEYIPHTAARAGPYRFTEGIEIEVHSAKSSYFDWAKIRFTGEYKPKLSLDHFGSPDMAYPVIPQIRSRKQFKEGAVVAAALPFGELTPSIIGEVRL